MTHFLTQYMILRDKYSTHKEPTIKLPSLDKAREIKVISAPKSETNLRRYISPWIMGPM